MTAQKNTCTSCTNSSLVMKETYAQLTQCLRKVGDVLNYLIVKGGLFIIPFSFQNTFFPPSFHVQAQKAAGAISF